MQVKKYTYFSEKYKKYLHKNDNKCIIMQSEAQRKQKEEGPEASFRGQKGKRYPGGQKSTCTGIYFVI